jgi:hypothetical protein
MLIGVERDKRIRTVQYAVVVVVVDDDDVVVVVVTGEG